jgi:hemoglobin
MRSLFEHAGGEAALHRLEQTFLRQRAARPIAAAALRCRPAGACRAPDHVTAESFGGPDRFTKELGFGHLIAVHRGLAITEEQRQRFVELYMAALDEAGMPTDEPFRPPSASTSSSAAAWQWRTPTPPPTPS